MKNTEKKKEESRNISIYEGSATSVMSGAGDSYVVPYALVLNANNAEIGFLTSFVNLFSSFSQLYSSKLVYTHSRKKVVLFAVFMQALLWLSLIAVGFLYWQGILKNEVVLLVIIFYSIIAIFGGIANPSWFSWMGDIVPVKIRGEYFSKRNIICGLIALIVTVTASFLLDYMKNIGFLIFGFWILFGLASLGRFISLLFFTKMYEPKTKVDKKNYFTFSQFIKKAPSTNFGRFSIYVGLINLATYFASPFFLVYMLKDLNYNYVWFTLVNFSSAIFTAISLPLWGKIGDYYGNKKLLTIGAIIIPFAPLPWLIFKNPIALIFTAQIIAGFGWAAFNLAASNFIYDAVTPQRRAICVAYYTVINGVCIFIGAFLGGLFAEYIVLSWINVLLIIFLISAVLRVIFSLIMIPKIKEVRNIPENKERLNFNQYINLITPRPFHDLFHGVKDSIVETSHINKIPKTPKR